MNSTTIHLEELPYQPDSCALFDCIRDLPGALLLDSGYPHTHAGRFDILTAEPAETLGFCASSSSDYAEVHTWFRELVKVHSSYCGGLVPAAEELPFCGGLAGYLDYSLGRPLQHLAPEPGARATVNLYQWAVVQDHVLQRCTFAALPSLTVARRQALLERVLDCPDTAQSGDFCLTGPFRSNMSREEYQRAFMTIQQYIRAGDCYQVNLAQRFSAGFKGEPWSAYCQLRPLAGAHFGGYMNAGDDRVLLSLSPERFLRLAGRHVETRPIKGTRPRSADPAADRQAAEELRLSLKDRAENLMIVDLLRNDIGRNCVPGSIHVDRLFELESYPTVHHLVSTISGELLGDRDAVHLLQDSFPGGSITGAPKRRAMEIIEELEPDSRAAYCGSMFYIGADGRMDSNIAIRSLLCEGGEIHCWGGGGIVADSDGEQEYQETWDKVGRFVEALESGLVLARA
jgi:para-aminobenzoate synthetase component 1